jgi:aspartate aminotransferase
MIDGELEDLLRPLERFESIRRRAVRLGDRLYDLSYANPYGGALESARAVLMNALAEERQLDLQYSPFGGLTLARRAVADALRASHGLRFRFDDVILTPGAMSALHIALHAVGRPGDEVIIPVPCWLDHPLYVRTVGLHYVLVPLTSGTFDLDVEAIAGAVTDRTCAVLLSHPANPTGRSYAAEQLAALALALGRAEARLGVEITLIADETHRDFTEAGQYRSAAEFWERILIVYSFGKYHFMQGQRLGYVATSPKHPAREQVSAELTRWTRITGIATPTALMQRAVPELLALQHDQGWLSRWRHRVVQQLVADGYTVMHPNATLFVYVRTPANADDFDFIAGLAAEGVLALPAPVFHHTGYFRLSLTGSEQMMESALPILKRFAAS